MTVQNPLHKLYQRFTGWLAQLAMHRATWRFRRHRATFYEDLAEAIADKESVAKFIRIRRTRAIQQQDPLARLYSVMLARLGQKGGTLSRMLQGIAPQTDEMVIASIENQNNVDEGLKFLASTVINQQSMTDAMRSAVIVPAIILSVCLFFIIIMAYFVIPVLGEIVQPTHWHGIARSIYLVSYVTTQFGVYLLAGFIAAGGWFIWSVANWIGPTRVILDRWVLYRVFRDYYGAVFLAALALLLMSGETLMRALEKLKRRASPWLRWHISNITNRLLTHTANYGEAFGTGIFGQDLVNRLIDASRRRGNFSEAIRKLGMTEVEAAKKRVHCSAKALNIALLFVLGGFITYLLLATMITAQGLSDSLQREISITRVRR